MSAMLMKDSGVEWLGEIPKHWKLATVRALCECRSGFGFPIEYQGQSAGDLPFYKVSDMNLAGNETIMRRANHYIGRSVLVALNAKTARAGATIFPKIGAAVHTNKKRLLAVEAVVDNNVMAVWARNDHLCNDEFLYRYFQAIHLSQLAQLGTVPTISTKRLYGHAVPLPPLAEQRAIAAYLDRETARIDGLIAKTQQLNALLREKRIALISHAVTKGLDPAVPLKDSGVEWLGEIPAHWDVKRLKHVTTHIGSGKTPRGGAEIYQLNGVLFIRSQNVHFEGLRLADVVFISEEIDFEMRSTRVRTHDVLLNITGASLGRCSIVTLDVGAANVNQHVCILRPHQSHISPEFLNYVVASNIAQSQIFSTENGSSREGITFLQIAHFWMSLPSDVAEQRAIADHLDSETTRIDALIAKNDQLIALLREKRTSLISAAVTGKIDLRNEA